MKKNSINTLLTALSMLLFFLFSTSCGEEKKEEQKEEGYGEDIDRLLKDMRKNYVVVFDTLVEDNYYFIVDLKEDNHKFVIINFLTEATSQSHKQAVFHSKEQSLRKREELRTGIASHDSLGQIKIILNYESLNGSCSYIYLYDKNGKKQKEVHKRDFTKYMTLRIGNDTVRLGDSLEIKLFEAYMNNEKIKDFRLRIKLRNGLEKILTSKEYIVKESKVFYKIKTESKGVKHFEGVVEVWLENSKEADRMYFDWVYIVI